jgi:hypothetical protein
LVRAAVRFWDTLDAAGDRYTNGSPYGQTLWSTQRGLSIALAELGLPRHLLQGPLPPEDPREFAAQLPGWKNEPG